MRRSTTTAIALLLSAGCATSGGNSVKDDLYWDAAKLCESRHRTIHLDRIDSNGQVSAHADAETRSELAAFTKCYQDEVKNAVDKRTKAGLPVPDGIKMDPEVELD